MKEFTVSEKDDGERLNRWLADVAPALPGAMMYRYLRLKRIKLNGKRAAAGDRLHRGDVVALYISDEFFVGAPTRESFMAAGKALSVVFEDANIALLYKPAGLSVHDDDTGNSDTLLNRFLRYLFEKGEYAPRADESFTPALCNRLDRGTFGIVIAAKNRAALEEMNAAVKRRDVQKFYLCAVLGSVTAAAEKRAFLLKDEKKNRVSVFDSPRPGAKEIITRFRPLRRRGELTLLEVELVTGRTHQIRAHLAYLGYPVLGDGKYGRGDVNRRYGLSRQALCAWKLHFNFARDNYPLLAYLDQREFSLPDVWFVDQLFTNERGD